jgi:hypothetical protein
MLRIFRHFHLMPCLCMQCDDIAVRGNTEPSDCSLVIEHEVGVILATTFPIDRLLVFENEVVSHYRILAEGVHDLLMICRMEKCLSLWELG